MANTVALKDILVRDTIAQLDALLPFKSWTNTKYEGELRRAGDTVSVHEINRFNGQYGGTAGASITATDWTYSTHDLQVDSVLQENAKVADIEEVRAKVDVRNEITTQYARIIAESHNKHIANEVAQSVHADNKLNEGNATALSSSNAFTEVEEMRRVLSKANSFEPAALFVDPATASFLRLDSKLFDSHSAGFQARTSGSMVASSVNTSTPVGQLSKFSVYETTFLPYKNRLDMATNPTADDTVTITLWDENADSDTTITFTFKAVPASAGEVDIGAAVSDTQTNLLNAINGTGTAGASTYIAVSAANRNLLDKYGVELQAWASDQAYLYTNDYLQTSVGETFTDGTDSWNGAAVVLVGMDRNACNFVDQLTKMKITDGEDGFFSQIPMESIYKAAVLGRNSKRIVTSEVTIQ